MAIQNKIETELDELVKQGERVIAFASSSGSELHGQELGPVRSAGRCSATSAGRNDCLEMAEYLLSEKYKKAGVYGPLVQKQITSWAALRNSAAHGSSFGQRLNR